YRSIESFNVFEEFELNLRSILSIRIRVKVNEMGGLKENIRIKKAGKKNPTGCERGKSDSL
ncbi:MAG: hypothetical protein SGI89_02310, partial [bacterium]|nr:hypothetical protein [bacterium]